MLPRDSEPVSNGNNLGRACEGESKRSKTEKIKKNLECYFRKKCTYLSWKRYIHTLPFAGQCPDGCNGSAEPG